MDETALIVSILALVAAAASAGYTRATVTAQRRANELVEESRRATLVLLQGGSALRVDDTRHEQTPADQFARPANGKGGWLKILNTGPAPCLHLKFDWIVGRDANRYRAVGTLDELRVGESHTLYLTIDIPPPVEARLELHWQDYSGVVRRSVHRLDEAGRFWGVGSAFGRYGADEWGSYPKPYVEP